jgi:hypothetical protein
MLVARLIAVEFVGSIGVECTMTMKKFWTVLAVLTCYGWGTFAWFTGGLLLSEELPTLAKLTNAIYLAALFAPFIRARLGRFTNTQLLVGLSVLSSLGLVAMMNRDWLPFGYLAVGFLRLFLMPVMTSFTAPNLGVVMTVVLLNGGFNGANALLKPFIAHLVAGDNWRMGLGIGIALIGISVVTARLASNVGPANPEDFAEQPNLKKLGSMVIVLIGIQLFYGLREIAVYRVANQVFGSTTSAGILEAITESAMLVGVIFTLTPYLRTSLVIPMLTAQAGASLLFAAAIHFSNERLLYTAQIVEGLSYAILERLSEVTYLYELGGLPNSGLAYQYIDTLTRIGPMPTRILAGSPLSLEIIFSVMAGVSLVIIVLYRSALADWTGNRFVAISSAERQSTRGLRLGIITILLIVQIRTSRRRVPRAAGERDEQRPLPLLSHRIR